MLVAPIPRIDAQRFVQQCVRKRKKDRALKGPMRQSQIHNGNILCWYRYGTEEKCDDTMCITTTRNDDQLPAIRKEL